MMSRVAHVAGAFLAVLSWAGQVAAQERFEPLRFAARFCADCHGAEDPEGDIDLLALTGTRVAVAELPRLLLVRDKVRSGEMPPEDEPQPDAATRAAFVDWAQQLAWSRAASGAVPAGRVPPRRLTAAQIANTLRDRFGVVVDTAALGDEPALSALHLEKMATIAREAAAVAIVTEDPDSPPVRVAGAELEMVDGKGGRSGDFVRVVTNGAIGARFRLPRTGDYEVRVHAYADKAGNELAHMVVAAGRKRVGDVRVDATRGAPRDYTFKARLEGGTHEVTAAFVNDYYNPKAPRDRRDRNLGVGRITVTGPLDALPIPEAHRWLFARDPGFGLPAARARPLVEALAMRAWRRPATGVEINRLCDLVTGAVARGESFARGVQLAFEAVLVSPSFLFRLENVRGGARGAGALDGWALASRLSYFLWDSAPDGELLRLARSGGLADTDVLTAQVRRMLVDDRVGGLARSFATHGLRLDALAEVQPDPELFPTFGDALLRSMRRETELFVESMLREGRPVSDLIAANDTFVDRHLAAHYGIAGVDGDGFRRVTAPADSHRGGVLGHASILTMTSSPTRTSPVLRGKWILDNLLDDPPATPPDDIPALEEDGLASPTRLREALELHRRNVVCASCHSRMDPLGFALENYDAVGRWRAVDGEGPIDASGTLPDGRALSGRRGLIEALRADRALLRSAAVKLFTLGVGRPPGALDRVVLDRIVGSLPADATFADIIQSIVVLDAFRRRGPGE